MVGDYVIRTDVVWNYVTSDSVVGMLWLESM